MKEILYISIITASFIVGWYQGLAGFPSTQWLAAPIFAFLAGAGIRLFWMKP